MTTAETIKCLEHLKWDYPLECQCLDKVTEYRCAIDRAIEELKQGGYEAGYMKGFRDGLMQRQKVRED